MTPADFKRIKARAESEVMGAQAKARQGEHHHETGWWADIVLRLCERIEKLETSLDETQREHEWLRAKVREPS
jgi:hypothetical protein